MNYRKKIYLPFLALFISGSALAQDGGEKSGVRFGVKAGLNISNHSKLEYKTPLETFKFKGRMGFHLGVFADMPINDKFSFQPEVLYSQKGAKWKDLDQVLELDYIDIPLLAKLKPMPSWNVYLGPSVGFAITHKMKNGPNIVKENYEKVDIGGIVGLGYQYSRYEISARYQMGFTGIYHKKNYEKNQLVTLEKNPKSSVIQISLAYTLY